MALTTAADYSGCIEFTVGYCGFQRFDSGKFAVSFEWSGASGERIYGKDPTLLGITASVLYVDMIQTSCSSGHINLYDGSGGTLLPGSIACTSGAAAAVNILDFGKDPLRCLTADTTSSLCVSADNGWVAGFIKCHWGTSL